MLALLIGANILPFMRSHLRNMAQEAYLVEGATVYIADGWPLVGMLVLLFVVLFPIARALLLTLVLGSVCLGARRAWQGRLFRYAEALRLWSMLDVMLIGAGVTFMRVSAQLQIDIEPGGYCFIGAAILALLTDGTMDRRRIWRSIHPESDLGGAEAGRGCDACGLALASTDARPCCPRCGKLVEARRRSLHQCAALTLAAFILYPSAYLLPMTQTVEPTGTKERTILDGVTELFAHDFVYLGLIVFVASVVIPLLKLIGLTWLMLRVRYPSVRGLIRRTRAFRVIHEINRWSFVDPFIVAATAPMMAYAGIADVDAGPGALPFAAVVTLTMLASRYYDPRLMWDAAGRQE